MGPVEDSDTDPTELITTGEDLLRPVWDFSGRIWEVDRRKSGAVVSYLRKGRMRVLDVEGISGKDVKDFLVSRDGSRLVAVIREDAERDSIVVSRILTTGDGQVAQALAADEITDPTSDGQIRDIAWRSPTSLVVLRPLSRDLFQIRTASVDGATGLDSFSVTIDGDVVGLAGTPIPGGTIYAFAAAVAADDGTPAHAEVRDLAGAGPTRSTSTRRCRCCPTSAELARRRPRIGPQPACPWLLSTGSDTGVVTVGRGGFDGRMTETVLDGALDLLLGGSCVGCARPGRLLCPACQSELSGPGRAGVADADAGGAGRAVGGLGLRGDRAGDGARPEGAPTAGAGRPAGPAAGRGRVVRAAPGEPGGAGAGPVPTSHRAGARPRPHPHDHGAGGPTAQA